MTQKAPDLSAARYEPFGRKLRDLLIEKEITNGMGAPNWMAFAELLKTVRYESLRKAITGERAPSALIMRECAEALHLDPAETFVEYKLLDAQAQFDPRAVGSAVALANLAAWTEFQVRKK